MPLNKDIYVNSGEMNESNLVLHRTNNAGDVTIDLSAAKQTKKLTWYEE